MSVLTIDEGIQKQKNEAFLKLVKKNPTLPIVPMVDCEVVGGEDCYWVGSFGSASVGEYTCYDDRFFDDREEFKERYYENNDEGLCEKFNFVPCMSEAKGYTKEQIEANKKNEKRLEEYLEKIANEYFTKAIIVYINLPD